MNPTTRTIAPIVAIVFLFAAAHWTVAQPGAEAAQEPQTGIISSAFEYYPAQFAGQFSDGGEHIPTF
jgi:hypothetical protein